MDNIRKIAIIGSPDTVLPFKSIGLDGYPVNNTVKAQSTLEEIISKGYGIIYLEEAFAKEFYNRVLELNKLYKEVSVTIIPGGPKGAGNFTMEKVRAMVKKAIGLDIQK